MDTLQHLQPLDFLMVVLWAGIVGWGLQTGLVRQFGMLIGLYAGTVLAASLYRPLGQALALVFGRGALPQCEFAGFVAVLLGVFAAIGFLMWRAYPLTRLSRGFGLDNLVGGLIGATWGALLLIALLTILRYYAATPWRGQETTQQAIDAQVRGSQLAPVLELATPLWRVMTPWFPAAVSPPT